MATTDTHITVAGEKRAFRLLQQQGRKLWTVKEEPPEPQLNLGGAAKEGLPPSRLLPFVMEDFSLGTGLLTFTPQTDRPGHTLRYTDGKGIDTSEPGIVRHGPQIESVGTTSSGALFAEVLGDTLFVVTNQHVYSWDGTTFTLEYTHGSATFSDAVVHGDELYIAAGTDYLHGTEAEWLAGSPTTKTDNADFLLSIGKQLWRAYDTNQISSSTDPGAASPTWAAPYTVGGGEAITNLYTISGLLGVATENTLFIIDSEGNNLELDNKLRTRRGPDAFSIATEGGSDVWFSDGINIIRLVAEGFEVFDVRPDGPYFSTDELPVSFPPPLTAAILGIAQDLEHVYVAASSGNPTVKHIYKGKEVARGLYTWTPIVYESGGSLGLLKVAKLPGEDVPYLYWNESGGVERVPLVGWSAYEDQWEIVTPYFTGGLPSWEKTFYKLRAFLDIYVDATVTPYYRVDSSTTWVQFGTSAMAIPGNNEITLSAPINCRRIQLRFVGDIGTDNTTYVNLLSFTLEGLLRVDADKILEFAVVSDNKSDNDFLNSTRTTNNSFITVTDRFDQDRNVFVLPGYPVEVEMFDEIERRPVRAYQFKCQEVT